MRKIKPKAFFITAAVVLCLAIGVCMLFWITAHNGTGELYPLVVNAYTLEPVQNAHVIVPGIADEITGADGRAVLEHIPVRIQRTYDTAVSRDWGELTLLVYAQGYLPNAIFCVQVYAGESRSEVKIYMFPEDEQDREYTVIVQPPPDEWTQTLLNEYAPDM